MRPQAAGTITNQASVASDEGDSNTADNSASAETTVDPAADLSLTKTDSPDPVLAGELLTYTLAVQNAGPSSADRRDAQRHAAGRRDVRLGHSLAGHLLRVERHGHLRARHDRRTARAPSVEIKIRSAHARPRSPTARPSSSLTADPDSADNSASAETTVTPAADLSLTKSDSPDPVLVGRRAHLHARGRERRSRRTPPASR